MESKELATVDKKQELVVVEKKIDVEGRSIVGSSLKIKVTAEDDIPIAMVAVDAIDKLQKEIDDTFDPIIQQNMDTEREAEKGRKLAVEKKELHSKGLKAAKAYLLKQINDFKMIETKKRQEEAKKEEERLRQLEEDKKLKEAEELESAGMVEEAQAKINEPVITPVVIPKKIYSGGAIRKPNYKFRVIDINKVPREWLKLDDVAVGQFVRAKKQVGQVIQGIECYVDYSDFTR